VRAKCTSRMYISFRWKDLLKIHTAHIPRLRYKEYNFDCELSKCRALLEECALLGFILVSFWGIFPKIRNSLSSRLRYKWRKFGCDRSIIKGNWLENKMPFRLYVGFHWRDFPETSYLALFTHTLQTMQVWLWSVNNEEHFTWKALCLLGSASPSMEGMLLKINILVNFMLHVETHNSPSWRRWNWDLLYLLSKNFPIPLWSDCVGVVFSSWLHS
jgi:hypothetical protein